MKDGRTLGALAAEIERQVTTKRDLVADTRALRLGDDLTLNMSPVDGAAFDPMPIRDVGGRIEEGTDAVKWLSDEALAADDKAILLKLRDIVRATFNEEVFQVHLGKMQAAADPETKIKGDPVAAIELLGETVGLGVQERGGVLRHLIEGGDLTQWGVLNAVTRYSQDVASYDRATELEEAGGKILTLAPSQWRRIATAEKVEKQAA